MSAFPGRDAGWPSLARLLVLPLALTWEGCDGESPERSLTAPAAVAAPSSAPTPTPPPLSLVAPLDGAVLANDPRSLTLRWTELVDSSAVLYTVELELGYFGSGQWDPIPQSSAYYGDCAGRIRASSCTTSDFPGAQPGRWRVGAENEEGKRTGPTPWRTFLFTGPGRRTDTFRFSLPAGSRASFVVGSVPAGNGPLDVTLAFSGDFIVLACVGTSSACYPMGGRPMTTRFDVPRDFPAGAIQAKVYFNYTYAQPPGDASGTVSFTYVPQ